MAPAVPAADARCVAALAGSAAVRDAAAACRLLAGAADGAPRRALREDGFATFETVADWGNAVGVVACVCLAALAAGLTMGIVSIDPTELYARRLLPLVEKEPHHQVLVTLLLANSFANEALPLFLDALAPSWAAILFSVGFVLVFGEILPSAVFTGPDRLRVAAALAPAVEAAVAALAPVAYPVARALDHFVPEDDRPTTGDARRVRDASAEMRPSEPSISARSGSFGLVFGPTDRLHQDLEDLY